MIVNVSDKTDLHIGCEYLLLKQSHAIIHSVTYRLIDDVSFYGKIHGNISYGSSTLFYCELLGVRRVLSFAPNKNGTAQRVVLSKDLYPDQR